ncbi:hypothetical protein NEOKW01_0672 [Nematocida sp. AWRm80]|nr:hypothetical protein NEOKW01_0672 [Nematocida sp. AWRm80]
MASKNTGVYKKEKRTGWGSNKNDSDHLYLDLEDRERLESLPEIEREKILYERHLQWIKEEERKELESRVGYLEDDNELDSISKESSDANDRGYHKHQKSSTYDIFKHTILSRDTLLRIVYRTIIDKITGYYIKIRLPSGYCIYKVLKVYEGKRYEVGNIITNKWMTVGRKQDKKEVNIQSISNVPVTKEEYLEYIKDNPVPGDKESIGMWKRISKEIEMTPSDEEANYTLSQKRRFTKYSKVTTRRKIDLKALLERAKIEHNQQQIQQIEKELKELEESP